MSVLERILLVYILMNLLFECQVNDIFLSLEYSVEFEIKKNFHLKVCVILNIYNDIHR